jgi:hypothetical protein
MLYDLHSKAVAPLCLAISITIICFGLLCHAAKADGATNAISVKPEKMNLDVSSGASIKKAITIVNDSDNMAVMSIAARSLEATSTDQKIKLVFASTTATSTRLIPEYLNISVPPRQQKTVNFLIYFPADTLPGKYYDAILFARASGNLPGPSKEFGTLITETIAASSAKPENIPATTTIKVSGGVTKFSNTVLQTDKLMDIKFLLNSTSDASLSAVGVINVSDWQGKNVTKLVSKSQMIKPSTETVFHWQWHNNLPAGLYKMGILLNEQSSNKQLYSREAWVLVLPRALIYSAIIFIFLFAIFVAIYNTLPRHQFAKILKTNKLSALRHRRLNLKKLS